MKRLPKRLTPALKKKWLAALRSGKYKKGKKTLLQNPNGDWAGMRGFNPDGALRWCCLGVLADVCGIRKEIGKHLSTEVLATAGRSQYYVLPQGIQHELAEMNDGKPVLGGDVKRGKSFKAIADWIEKNL